MKAGKRPAERCVQQNFSVFPQSLLGSGRAGKERTVKQRPIESVKKSRREGIGSVQDERTKVTVNGDVVTSTLSTLVGFFNVSVW